MVEASRQGGKVSAQVTPWWHEAIKLFAASALGALATIVVGYFTFFNASRELDLKMVDVSLAILSGEKGGIPDEVADQAAYDEYYEARKFALRALERYSGVPIEEGAKERWARSGKISFGIVPTSNYWAFGKAAFGGADWLGMLENIRGGEEVDALLSEASTWASAESGACEQARTMIRNNKLILSPEAARPILVENCAVESPDSRPASGTGP